MGHQQLDAFRRLAPMVRAEAGCLRYDLHRVDGDDDCFLLLEEWTSPAALDAHGAAEHMVAQAAENATFRAGPPTILRYSPEPVA